MKTTMIDEKKMEEKFRGDQNLQTEFGCDVKAFLEFSKANADGRVQICRSKVSMMSAEQFRDEVQLEELNRKLAANEAELKRLSGLQNKIDENEAAQYASGVAC